MSTPADISVYGEDGQLQALVEVKAKSNATSRWASQLRRNLLSHWPLSNPRYFLIVSPDHLYIWSGGRERPEDRAPNQELEFKALLDSVWPGFKTKPSNEQSLELATAAFLRQLAIGGVSDSREIQCLKEIGFVDAIKNGRIEAQGPL